MLKVISLLCLSLFFTTIVSQEVVSVSVVEYNSSDCSGTPTKTAVGEINNGVCTFGVIYKFYSESTLSFCVYDEVDCSGTAACTEIDAGCAPALPGHSDMISWTFGPAPTPAPGTSDVYVTTSTYSQENCLGPKTSSFTITINNGECFIEGDESLSYNFTEQSLTACLYSDNNDCTGTPEDCSTMLSGCIDMGDGTSMETTWIFDNGTNPTSAPTPSPTTGPTMTPNQAFNVTSSSYSQIDCSGNVDTKEYLVLVNGACNNEMDFSSMYIFYDSSIQVCGYFTSSDCTGSSSCGTVYQGCNNLNDDGDSVYISWEPVSAPTTKSARNSNSLLRAFQKN